MATFVRRFLQDPGNAVLLEIESVNIIDIAPPNSIAGLGTGAVTIVGEFEDGPFNMNLEVGSATDLVALFGALGYSYGGVQGNNPCAVLRKADGALAAEPWNGNGFIQLSGKRFARLFVTRADTSVGAVQLTPMAYVTGGAAFRYVLAAGQVLALDLGSSVGGAGPVNATFSATAATVTSGAQTFPTLFAGGETLTLGYDGQPNFTVFFQASDQTQAAVIARINQFAGFTTAATVTSTTMSLTGIQKGSQAQVRVVAASAPAVLTALGLAVATTFGTGNVADILAVTAQEVASVVQAAVTNTSVQLDANGALRVSNTLGTASSWIAVGAATTATALGFVAGQVGTVLGVATVLGVGGVFPATVGGTITLAYDSAAPFNVVITIGDTAAAVITSINAAAGATISYADGTQVRLLGKLPGGTVSVVGASAGPVLAQLGFSVGTVGGAGIPLGSIPAGTLVQDTTLAKSFVTMQAVQFTSQGVLVGGPDTSHGAVVQPTAGPYSVKVRHALDDGTGTVANAGTLTVLPRPVQLLSVKVVNATPTTAALTESQVDAAYVAALDATLDTNTVSKECNIIYAARQSNVVRRQLRSNALFASGNGLFGRIACIRPPLGTTKFTATSVNAEPGVGAYRDQRVIYVYPAAKVFVQQVAQRGASGGPGFTPDGNVDVGADGWLASIMSQLPPEENPGQDTTFASAVVSVESSPNAQGFNVNDYKLFKAKGIAALRVDSGVAGFQSGVTSVDPAIFEGLKNIARRRMADFIQDSLSELSRGYSKRLSTEARRKALDSEVRSFLDQLLNKGSPNGHRIQGYSVDSVSGNTRQTLALGIFRIDVNVQTLASIDAVVFQMMVGESSAIPVTEVAPLAA
jgi:hypothetical protein